jgi:solute carrier family 25 protein 38
VATSITNPFDAVKTRLQLMPRKYGNMLKATRTMLQEDGLRSFFDGLGLRMSRKAISSALAWTVYEELIGRAERHFAEEQRLSSAL